MIMQETINKATDVLAIMNNVMIIVFIIVIIMSLVVAYDIYKKAIKEHQNRKNFRVKRYAFIKAISVWIFTMALVIVAHGCMVILGVPSSIPFNITIFMFGLLIMLGIFYDKAFQLLYSYVIGEHEHKSFDEQLKEWCTIGEVEILNDIQQIDK